LHGRDRGAKAILLLAHIDVVEARREDWQRDPFKLVEENGWFYARGASDDKAMAAVFTDSSSVTAKRDSSPGATSSSRTARILDPVRAVAAKIWPGVPLVPTMSTGATDGRFLTAHGVPTYGLSGMFHDAEGPRAHGLNERIRVVSLMNGRRFLYEVVKLYANQP